MTFADISYAAEHACFSAPLVSLYWSLLLRLVLSFTSLTPLFTIHTLKHI